MFSQAGHTDCLLILSCNSAPAWCEEAKISASKQVLNHFKYDHQGLHATVAPPPSL